MAAGEREGVEGWMDGWRKRGREGERKTATRHVMGREEDEMCIYKGGGRRHGRGNGELGLGESQVYVRYTGVHGCVSGVYTQVRDSSVGQPV